jgi:hypothetical protein
MFQPESGDARIGAVAGHRPTRVVAAAGAWGRGRHEQFCLPLFTILIALRSGHRFRAGTLAFASPSRYRDRGDQAGVPETRGGIGRQDGTNSLHHIPDMSQ